MRLLAKLAAAGQAKAGEVNVVTLDDTNDVNDMNEASKANDTSDVNDANETTEVNVGCIRRAVGTSGASGDTATDRDTSDLGIADSVAGRTNRELG